jgi:hypothetical protein
VATEVWKHDVEDDDVVWLLAGQPESIRAVQRDVHGEAVRLEPLADAGRQPLLVLDDQDAHATIIHPNR